MPTAATRSDRPFRILLDDTCVVGFKSGEGSIEHFPARHNHEIQPWTRLERRSDLMAPEQLSRQAFRAIPTNGLPQFPAGRYPESRMRRRGRNHDQRHESPVNPTSFRIGPVVVCPPAYSLVRWQAAPTLRHASLRRRPSDVFVPWPGDASAQFGRSWWPCEPGTHAPSCADGCSVETCAFPSCGPTYGKQACLS